MGKSSILLVLGFMVVLSIVMPNIGRMSNRSVENYINYNDLTQAHNITVSGVNQAANEIFLNNTWRTGYSHVPFAGGEYNVTASNYGVNQVALVSVGKYNKIYDTSIVILQPSSYAKFAYYSKVEGGITWIGKDTVWGPFHTQDVMKISGSPVFYGKVTTRLGTNPIKTSAKFYGGYQSGVDVNLPTDLNSPKTAATAGGRVFPTGDVWIKFSKDTVKWKTSSTGTVTSTLLSSFAPNGVICASQGNIHVEGLFKGQATLLALGSSASGYGNIYIDDNITYETDPRVTTSNDMLGLVCDNNVIISNNAANNNDVNIQASIFCRTGGFTAENYSSRGVSGGIHLLGGIIQNQRGAVGTFSGSSTITSGFYKDYRYDERFYMASPPFFPNTGSYEIVSWLE